MRWLTLIFFVHASCVFAQPDLSSKQTQNGIVYYKDFRQANTYYLQPPKLSLIREPDGRPRITLINSRYTGSSVYGDVGEKKFRNILQFGITMEAMDLESIKSLKNQLGGTYVNLLMMPLKNVETTVMMPAASAQKSPQKIGKNGSFTAASNDENTFGFWKERTYSVHLENQEAELVSHLMTEGKLFLTFNYSLNGEAIRGTKAVKRVINPRQVFQSVQTDMVEVIKVDTSVTTIPFRSDAFSINVDTQKWNLIRKIDINENVPPAYSALEVRCYDFTNQIRPDLAVKVLDIEATGLNNTPVSLPSIRFLSSNPSTNTIAASFPFAVKLTKPLRYRIVEYKKNGEKTAFDWISKDNWVEVIDITTPLDSIKYKNLSFEFEVSPEVMADSLLKSIEVEVQSKNSNKPQKNSLEFAKDTNVFTNKLKIISDKNEPVFYKIIINGIDKTYETELKKLEEDYVLINPKLLGF